MLRYNNQLTVLKPATVNDAKKTLNNIEGNPDMAIYSPRSVTTSHFIPSPIRNEDVSHFTVELKSCNICDRIFQEHETNEDIDRHTEYCRQQRENPSTYKLYNHGQVHSYDNNQNYTQPPYQLDAGQQQSQNWLQRPVNIPSEKIQYSSYNNTNSYCNNGMLPNSNMQFQQYNGILCNNEVIAINTNKQEFVLQNDSGWSSSNNSTSDSSITEPLPSSPPSPFKQNERINVCYGHPLSLSPETHINNSPPVTTNYATSDPNTCIGDYENKESSTNFHHFEGKMEDFLIQKINCPQLAQQASERQLSQKEIMNKAYDQVKTCKNKQITFKCNYESCRKSKHIFSTRQKAAQHVIAAHFKIKIWCKKCQKVVAQGRLDNAKAHMKTVHNHQGKTNKTFTCPCPLASTQSVCRKKNTLHEVKKHIMDRKYHFKLQFEEFIKTYRGEDSKDKIDQIVLDILKRHYENVNESTITLSNQPTSNLNLRSKSKSRTAIKNRRTAKKGTNKNCFKNWKCLEAEINKALNH